MASIWIGVPDALNDRCVSIVKHLLERRRGINDSNLLIDGEHLLFWNREFGSRFVILVNSIRHNCAQPVVATTELKYDEDPLVFIGYRSRQAAQRRRQA